MVFVYRASAAVPPKALSDYAEGDIIKLNENGVPVEFYVSCHNYQSGYNGLGRTLVVRKYLSDLVVYRDTFETNVFAGSILDNWLNSTYKARFTADIQSAMGTTIFNATDDDYSVGVISRAIFSPSVTEMGLTHSRANVEGYELPIAGVLRIATEENGTAYEWYTRTPYVNIVDYAFAVQEDGSVSAQSIVFECDTRPCFTLPSTLLFNSETNEVVT